MNETKGRPTKITRKDIFDRIKDAQTFIQLVITLITVVIILASYWLSSLLKPVEQNIAVIHQQVDAQNGRIDHLENYLVRIEDKLDRVIENR